MHVLITYSGHVAYTVASLASLMDFCGNDIALNTLLCAGPHCPPAPYCILYTCSVSCFLLPFDVRPRTVSFKKEIITIIIKVKATCTY